MKLSHRAFDFAFRALMNSDCPDKVSKLFHLLIVGSLLKLYGYDDSIVAAGYLHEVLEYSDYKIEEISKLFGGNIASLILTCKKIDSSLDFDERVRQECKIYKNMPDKSKAIITADKISDLEKFKMEYLNDLVHLEDINVDEVKHYYEKILESLSFEFRSPLIDRLYRDIHSFYSTSYPSYNWTTYSRELNNLKEVLKSNSPYIIEITDNFGENKSDVKSIISDFINGDNYKLKVVEDADIKGLSIAERNLLVATAIDSNLLTQILDGKKVLLVSEFLYNILIHFSWLVKSENMTKETLNFYIESYTDDIKDLFSHVVISCKNNNKVVDSDALDNCTRLICGNDDNSEEFSDKFKVLKIGDQN